MKALAALFLQELASLLLTVLALVGLFAGIPWLYEHYGAQGDWWVFGLAVSVVALPLLGMCWYAARYFRKFKERRTP